MLDKILISVGNRKIRIERQLLSDVKAASGTNQPPEAINPCKSGWWKSTGVKTTITIGRLVRFIAGNVVIITGNLVVDKWVREKVVNGVDYS
ncbi:hypothetical protein Pcinc_037371 [Petrolisthes cinctipes]|uniref:Uncharacterized protein n=1 Tax=Petrolisthes cinctipes TaxID=88211 RepID=A0AAE1EL31_PETCI|nr:hypothetical protein Pcinc_037371 [Petrolisthes cinctipes]